MWCQIRHFRILLHNHENVLYSLAERKLLPVAGLKTTHNNNNNNNLYFDQARGLARENRCPSPIYGHFEFCASQARFFASQARSQARYRAQARKVARCCHWNNSICMVMPQSAVHRNHMLNYASEWCFRVRIMNLLKIKCGKCQKRLVALKITFESRKNQPFSC